MNQRVDHVLDRLEGLLDHLIDDGWLESGFLPFEVPNTPKLQRKMLRLMEDQLADQNPELQAAQALEALGQR